MQHEANQEFYMQHAAANNNNNEFGAERQMMQPEMLMNPGANMAPNNNNMSDNMSQMQM